MLDINEAAQRIRGRAEVLGGVIRRRRWTAEEKGRIVAEAVAPEAVIAHVARRHDLTPQHLSNWVRAAKSGRIALSDESGLGFVPVVAAGKSLGLEPMRAERRSIEIVFGPVVVRIANGTDARTIETVLRVLARR